MNLKFLILLFYYNRPKMVRNALRSIKELDYDNFEIAFIDDGSAEEKRLDLVVPEFLYHLPAGALKHYYISDTPDDKIRQGGSRFGLFANEAILKSDADIIVPLCDDDALIKDSLGNLNNWFQENPSEMYCYSHVRIFNAEEESPFYIGKRPHWTNRTERIQPSCAVDSSQVVFRKECFEDGVGYDFPRTKDLDADLFTKLFVKYGYCPYTGFDTQYKNYSPSQLGNRDWKSQLFINIDIKEKEIESGELKNGIKN